VTSTRIAALLLAIASSTGCSIRTFAINKVGDALASGNSVYETDDDIELVGQALPFALKLTESLIAQSPDHPGLLLTACRGFVLYSYAYVQSEAELEQERDLDRARAMRERARRLYLRGLRYGFRALERSYPGIEQKLLADPHGAVAAIGAKNKGRDVPLLYWTSAALGLAISVSRDDAALLARLPEVEALLDRALALEESWDAGALHEFKVIFAGASIDSAPDSGVIERHYRRALELSQGRSAGLYVAYAEAVALPAQNKGAFRSLIQQALAVDPDRQPDDRLATLVTQRRARWLLERIDELFLADDSTARTEGGLR
jgi:predicted anti-sigma-YlaC factor YlaD